LQLAPHIFVSELVLLAYSKVHLAAGLPPPLLLPPSLLLPSPLLLLLLLLLLLRYLQSIAHPFLTQLLCVSGSSLSQ
jgi:hypothetical protein